MYSRRPITNYSPTCTCVILILQTLSLAIPSQDGLELRSKPCLFIIMYASPSSPPLPKTCIIMSFSHMHTSPPTLTHTHTHTLTLKRYLSFPIVNESNIRYHLNPVAGKRNNNSCHAYMIILYE